MFTLDAEFDFKDTIHKTKKTKSEIKKELEESISNKSNEKYRYARKS